MENKSNKSKIEEGNQEWIDVKECDIDRFQCMAQSIMEGVKCIDPIYEYRRSRQNIWMVQVMQQLAKSKMQLELVF